MVIEGTLVKDAPKGQHFRPRHGHPVKWMRFGGAEAVKTLDISKPYLNGDRVPRWGGGDYVGLSGLIMMVGRGERQFGEAHAILEELFRQSGITDPVTEGEAIDFAVMNGPNEGTDALGPADWMRLAGKESPVPQEGLGTARNPIIVADDRFPPNHKMEIDGKWYMNDLREGRGRFPGAAKPAEPRPPAPPSPPVSGRTINVDFNCTPERQSHFIDLPPGTTRLDGDLMMVIPEDPRQVLLRHFTDAETGASALNITNLRISFFALRGNNTGSERKPKRVLRWGFTQSAQLNARAEGDITAKDGQLAGPRLALPGVHRIRFTHLTTTGGTTFTFSDGEVMKVVSKETGPLNSARFWLGTNLPADPADTSYIPSIGRITGSLTIDGAGQEPIIPPVNQTPGPITAAELTEARRIIRELQTELAALARVLG